MSLAALAASLVSVPVASAQGAAPAPGLAVTFAAGEGRDVTSVPNVWLFVPGGGTPSPFLAPGRFTANFEGQLNIDLRGDYAFQAELNGALKLEVNGETVLDAKATGGATDLSKFIRLNKGANALKATFTPPDSGDAFVRLNWQEKGKFTQPIPPAQLSHSVTPAIRDSEQVHLGRELVVEHHCLACHAGPKDGMPELKMDAPSLEGIGARRQSGWLAKWIADPKALRPNAHMPKLLHGEKAGDDADAMAAYLVSLSPAPAAAPKAPEAAAVEAGQKLFESLHCSACHIHEAPKPEDWNRVTLRHVAQKFSQESLVAFLKQPSEHYAWIKMPEFRLKDEQRSQLAAYVLSLSEKADGKPVPAEDALIARGKTLVQSTGCLNCHALKEENKFSAKSLADLKAFDQGCVAESANGKSPFFGFTAEQRAALKAFAATDRSSLTRHVPAEFAERQLKSLNCGQCHGAFDTLPVLTWFGEKLKPEFMTKFIGGETEWKARPWLESQMPGFKARAALLAEGLSHQHGLDARLKPDAAVDESLAKLGHQLAGPTGGLSCTACHSVGAYHAEAFEAPGINFARVGERMRGEFFVRWLRNPTYIDPNTKMPVYFDDEGKSALPDVLGGDALKQIDALWNYMKQGDKMPLPKLE